MSKLSLFLEKLKIHKFKILGGVLLVSIFAGSVFGAYKLGQRQAQLGLQPTPTPMVVATPTPDPTANWKTYTTETLLFKYPSVWTVKETTKDFFVLLPEVSIPPLSAPISLDARREETYDQSIQDNKENLVDPNTEVTTVAGKPATRITGKVGPGFGEGAFVVSVVIDYQGRAVVFGYSDFSGKEEGPYRETFNLILSTFKFLEEETPTPEEFTCPPAGTLDCMPGPDRPELKYCTSEYSAWIEANCPGVQIVW